ncbi:hypothetical protein TNCV_747911 [Trichonephila clavipes]|nr:hypothetical protein TNCV_747911 [Trichonephila clavipes]
MDISKREKHTKECHKDRLRVQQSNMQPDLKKLICEHIIRVLQHQKDVNQKQHICVKHDFVPQNSKQNRKSLLVDISQEFQNSSVISASSRTVRPELKNLRFHGRAAAHKPNITPQNANHRLPAKVSLATALC